MGEENDDNAGKGGDDVNASDEEQNLPSNYRKERKRCRKGVGSHLCLPTLLTDLFR